MKVVDSGDGHFPPPTASVSWRNLAFLSSVANLGSLLFGYDTGATTWLLIRIAQYGVGGGAGFDDDQYRVFVSVARNPLWVGLVGAGSSIGATAAFMFLLFFGNGIPKNDEIMLSALMYFTGALLESSAGAVSWHNNIGLCLLLSGRLLYGTGIALTFHSVPQYISEISPRVGRGSLGSLTEAMTVTGLCLGFLVGYLDSKGSGFVVTFRVGYLIAVVMGMLAMVLPRSPLWLARKGADDEEILEALQFIRPAVSLEAVADVRKTTAANDSDKLQWEGKLRKMEQQQRLGSDGGGGGGGCVACCAGAAKAPQTKLLVLHRALRRSLGLALSLAILAQLGGQGALVYYAGAVFDQVCCLLRPRAWKCACAHLSPFPRPQGVPRVHERLRRGLWHGQALRRLRHAVRDGPARAALFCLGRHGHGGGRADRAVRRPGRWPQHRRVGGHLRVRGRQRGGARHAPVGGRGRAFPAICARGCRLARRRNVLCVGIRGRVGLSGARTSVWVVQCVCGIHGGVRGGVRGGNFPASRNAWDGCRGGVYPRWEAGQCVLRRGRGGGYKWRRRRRGRAIEGGGV